jgi:hypothetical protein
MEYYFEKYYFKQNGERLIDIYLNGHLVDCWLYYKDFENFEEFINSCLGFITHERRNGDYIE